MQTKFFSTMVDDREKAPGLHAETLGFEKRADIPMGPFRWLTVGSPDGLPRPSSPAWRPAP